MFGLPDFWIWSAYLLCILSTVVCVVYGLLNWNKGNDIAGQCNGSGNGKWEDTEEEIKAQL